MPIIKSAKKRVRVARKATLRNAKTKRSLKRAISAFQSNLGSKTKAASSHAAAQKELSKALKKHVIHKNKAARKQAQLARAAKAAGVSLAPKAQAKKPTTKKPVPKKKVVKK